MRPSAVRLGRGSDALSVPPLVRRSPARAVASGGARPVAPPCRWGSPRWRAGVTLTRSCDARLTLCVAATVDTPAPRVGVRWRCGGGVGPPPYAAAAAVCAVPCCGAPGRGRLAGRPATGRDRSWGNEGGHTPLAAVVSRQRGGGGRTAQATGGGGGGGGVVGGWGGRCRPPVLGPTSHVCVHRLTRAYMQQAIYGGDDPARSRPASTSTSNINNRARLLNPNLHQGAYYNRSPPPAFPRRLQYILMPLQRSRPR